MVISKMIKTMQSCKLRTRTSAVIDGAVQLYMQLSFSCVTIY